MKNNSCIKESRAALIALSKALRPLVKAGEYDSINEAVIASYTDEENEEFCSFIGWKKQGYSVQKGAKGWPIWGRPKRNPIKDAAPGEEETYKFWPIAYLFSNAQVKPEAERMAQAA